MYFRRCGQHESGLPPRLPRDPGRWRRPPRRRHPTGQPPPVRDRTAPLLSGVGRPSNRRSRTWRSSSPRPPDSRTQPRPSPSEGPRRQWPTPPGVLVPPRHRPDRRHDDRDGLMIRGSSSLRPNPPGLRPRLSDSPLAGLMTITCCALLRRTRRDAPQGGRPVRLPS